MEALRVYIDFRCRPGGDRAGPAVAGAWVDPGFRAHASPSAGGALCQHRCGLPGLAHRTRGHRLARGFGSVPGHREVTRAGTGRVGQNNRSWGDGHVLGRRPVSDAAQADLRSTAGALRARRRTRPVSARHRSGGHPPSHAVRFRHGRASDDRLGGPWTDYHQWHGARRRHCRSPWRDRGQGKDHRGLWNGSRCSTPRRTAGSRSKYSV